MDNYKVWIRSKPGMYQQYDGYVDGRAEDVDSAIDRAFTKLQRTSFPDRGPGMWKVEKVELTGYGNERSL